MLVLNSAAAPFLVNANTGVAAEQWRADMSGPSVGFRGGDRCDECSDRIIRWERISWRRFLLREFLVHADDVEVLSRLGSLPVENLSASTLMSFGDEVVHLIPVTGGPMETDLVVFFRKSDRS